MKRTDSIRLHFQRRQRQLIAGLLAAGTSLLGACEAFELEPGDSDETASQAQGLYVDSDVIWPSGNIPVCWETAGYATEKAWVRDALVDSWQKASAVRFTGWDSCQSGEAGIHALLHDAGGVTLHLGTGIDKLDHGIQLNLWGTAAAPKICAAGFTREECIRSTAVHEFGHALGFAHEQNRPDAPDGWDSDCNTQGSNGDTTVGSPDIDSVMNYCNPIRNGNGILSATDIAGVRKFYPGNVHQHKIDADGTIGAYVQQHDWSSGYTTTEFFNVGGNTYSFLLKESTGTMHTWRLKADGTYGTEVASGDWTSGWSQARFFTAGGDTYLFLLKTAEGKVSIRRMNDDGTLGTEVGVYDWTSGWTTARFFVAGGKTYLFLLKSADGKVSVRRMNDNGTLGVEVDSGDWTSGWSTVETFVSGGNPYLFLLKKATGEIHIQKLNGDGTVGARVDTLDFTGGWTSAAFYVRGASTYVMLVKASDGTQQTYKVNANGSLGDNVDTKDWTSGWTNVVSYKVGATPYLFLYKQ